MYFDKIRQNSRKEAADLRQNQNRISDVEPTELIRKIQNGDHFAFDSLCGVYEPLLRSMTASADERYRQYGSEYEDLKQEATLALYKAAMSYHTEQSDVTFGLFAKICIRNRLISAGRRLIRQHEAKYASVQKELDRRTSAGSPTISWTPDLSALSRYELRVYDLYIKGFSYARIAEVLGKEEKSIDNAIYRIRRKLREQSH